ncbi:uncharacterized protein RAG0_04667 [Rhynchosporium agropyri]|uniref:FAD-binding domain-containing protein n=1 Tax=Rhynchosporium agropyri TaxID=914238 RepID=A0A1E1KA05_9HELO|nr:uncharacterized protein RAG0_04667 [Rhynchosporium agropyri]
MTPDINLMSEVEERLPQYFGQFKSNIYFSRSSKEKFKLWTLSPDLNTTMANHQSQCNFKAIITGGSVAGLTFAHMFERANINCILLESRYRISPSEAASIVIMPKGARILDQLGYINGICERRIFLRSIFDQMKDKSRVKTGKRVTYIEDGESSVTVLARMSTDSWAILSLEQMEYIVGLDSRCRNLQRRSPRLLNKDKTGSRELMVTSETVPYFPFEEASHEVLKFGSLVCVGDAVHKMTSNMGQRGNPAIENAGETRGGRRWVENADRGDRGNFDEVSAVDTAASDALATLAHTLRFLFQPTTADLLADLSTELFRSSPSLNVLPQPSRTAGNRFWAEDDADVTTQSSNLPPMRPSKARLPLSLMVIKQ